jgi:CRISPR-associated protein Cas1
MIKRIIEISNPAYVSCKDSQMVIERTGLETASIPIEDVGILILDHPQITFTQVLMSWCAENNTAVLICDKRHLPAGLVLPFEGNNIHSKTIAMQIKISEPVRKRLWQAIVRAKIRAQAKALGKATGEPGPLPRLAERVRSGDPDNKEAQASRIYWQRLFGKDFRRDPDGRGANILLNYGYAVVRASMARAIVSTGLHPSLGLHHCNQYNSFCLADDLLEPVRPAVDLLVYEIVGHAPLFEPELTQENKRALLDVLRSSMRINGRKLPLITALHHYAAGIRKVMCGEEKEAVFPEI